MQGTLRFELVVFDMAGTTVYDDGSVLECFAAAAQATGLSASRDELNERMGQSKIEVFDELARRQLGHGAEASALRDRAYDVFRRVLEGTYQRRGAQPIPGAVEAFRWLREREIRIALSTGFYREVTELLLDRLAWRDVADTVVCADDVPEGRPAPYLIHEAMRRCRIWDVAKVVAVGDTPSDLLAGKNAGAGAVFGVTSGAHRAVSLRRYPATQILDSVQELPAILERLNRIGMTR